jgi:hypothetical protein
MFFQHASMLEFGVDQPQTVIEGRLIQNVTSTEVGDNARHHLRSGVTWLLGWSQFLDVNDIFGYLAGGLVLLTFTMRLMRTLRMIAIMSNVAFIYYETISHIRPVLILHGVLLPVNVIRLVQLEITR